MPLYEFKCETCGVFDVWRSLAESDQPATCPTCQTIGKRIFSAPAVSLSGSLPLRGGSEPDLIKKQQELQQPKFQSQACGRPWMLNH